MAYRIGIDSQTDIWDLELTKEERLEVAAAARLALYGLLTLDPNVLDAECTDTAMKSQNIYTFDTTFRKRAQRGTTIFMMAFLTAVQQESLGQHPFPPSDTDMPQFVFKPVIH